MPIFNQGDDNTGEYLLPTVANVQTIGQKHLLVSTELRSERKLFLFDTGSGGFSPLSNFNSVYPSSDLNRSQSLFLYQDSIKEEKRTPGIPGIYQQTIRKLDLSNSETSDLIDGMNPKISRDGNQVALLQDSNLVISDVEGNNQRTLLSKEKIEPGTSIFNYHWRTDGKALWVITGPVRFPQATQEDFPNHRVDFEEMVVPSINALEDISVYEMDVESGSMTRYALDWKQVKETFTPFR